MSDPRWDQYSSYTPPRERQRVSSWEAVPELTHRYHFWRGAAIGTWIALAALIVALSR